MNEVVGTLDQATATCRNDGLNCTDPTGEFVPVILGIAIVVGRCSGNSVCRGAVEGGRDGVSTFIGGKLASKTNLTNFPTEDVADTMIGSAVATTSPIESISEGAGNAAQSALEAFCDFSAENSATRC